MRNNTKIHIQSNNKFSLVQFNNLPFKCLLPVMRRTWRLTSGRRDTGPIVWRLFLLRSSRAREDKPTKAWSANTSMLLCCKWSSCRRCRGVEGIVLMMNRYIPHIQMETLKKTKEGSCIVSVCRYYQNNNDEGGENNWHDTCKPLKV